MSRPMSSSGRRPTTGMRPASGMKQAPPATGMRVPTGAMQVPGTGRPGTRGGTLPTGGVLDSRINVVDRPTTQQGLGGMRTAKKGPQRVVMDSSYYLGLLRTKMSELATENARLQKEIDTVNDENDSFLSYEKRAELKANEIKQLQGQLGDYNMLLDKVNTDTEMDDVIEDYNELKEMNEEEAKNIDVIFSERQDKEHQIQQIEQEIQQCRRMADTLIEDMDPVMKQKYVHLKKTSEKLSQDLEGKQQELDMISTKKENLEDELSQSQVKQEAVRLYEQLHELETKKMQLIQEEQSKGSPAEEREKLLRQVKEDNQEIARIEKQTKEFKDQVMSLQNELQELDQELEDHQGEKNSKYKELKKREETMSEFFNSFEETKKLELERNEMLQSSIVALLGHISRNVGRQKHMPTPKELARMQDDLNFKQNEMQKSEATASSLAGESTRLQVDLEKVEQLEMKIKEEMEQLKLAIDEMQSELDVFSDLETVKKNAEEKKKKLGQEKVILAKRKEIYKKDMQELSSQYEALKAQLNENETFTQLGNMERKWQHHEQNNFVMKEFIANKSMESDYQPIVRDVQHQLNEYNKLIQDGLIKGAKR
ncbi:intraflagellar transport protein 74 homolog [Antedon mediterranea]|uniref:intraflagellar transport protein 74 homolog n=1 Tax=Antedon mediterranea TaxID=105859 RepID=UPI003AF4D888